VYDQLPGADQIWERHKKEADRYGMINNLLSAVFGAIIASLFYLSYGLKFDEKMSRGDSMFLFLLAVTWALTLSYSQIFLVIIKWFNKDAPFLTAYGMLNSGESFTEIYTAYVLERKDLQNRAENNAALQAKYEDMEKIFNLTRRAELRSDSRLEEWKAFRAAWRELKKAHGFLKFQPYKKQEYDFFRSLELAIELFETSNRGLRRLENERKDLIGDDETVAQSRSTLKEISGVLKLLRARLAKVKKLEELIPAAAHAPPHPDEIEDLKLNLAHAVRELSRQAEGRAPSLAESTAEIETLSRQYLELMTEKLNRLSALFDEFDSRSLLLTQAGVKISNLRVYQNPEHLNPSSEWIVLQSEDLADPATRRQVATYRKERGMRYLLVLPRLTEEHYADAILAQEVVVQEAGPEDFKWAEDRLSVSLIGGTQGNPIPNPLMEALHSGRRADRAVPDDQAATRRLTNRRLVRVDYAHGEITRLMGKSIRGRRREPRRSFRTIYK
jgi:hypothetical protein